MGNLAHMLGEKKLRRLVIKTGMPFTSAYRRGSTGEARLQEGVTCLHYTLAFGINNTISVYGPLRKQCDWYSCPVNQYLRENGFHTGVGEQNIM
ncbi:hypothetical protein Curie_22 [Microbacterium phage Curie]